MADATKPIEATLPKTVEEVQEFLKKAESGDTSILPALRRLLQGPGGVELFGGGLAARAEKKLIWAIAGKNLVFQETVTRQLEQMRTELAGTSPSALERLLVERVVADWLYLHEAEYSLMQTESEMTLTQGEYAQRCRDRAHKRYLAAIRALALVRKLALPVLQLNPAPRPCPGASNCTAPRGRQNRFSKNEQPSTDDPTGPRHAAGLNGRASLNGVG